MHRFQLPASLPVPKDDGGCSHLVGTKIPSSVLLQATDNTWVSLHKLSGLTLVYCYPRTGKADKPVPEGWDDIPGARGCTPESCAFKEHSKDLSAVGVNQLFGLSTQCSDYQQEVVRRLQLPFPILSDSNFMLTDSIRLPTFEFGNFGRLIRRCTLVIENGVCSKVFYPIFPPDKHPEEIIKWLQERKF